VNYQLVIQLSGDDLDALVRLEEAVVERLGDLGDVDGHDIGRGEMNIFIFTDNPRRAFDRIRPTLTGAFAAAFRQVEADSYVVLFPPGLKSFDVL